MCLLTAGGSGGGCSPLPAVLGRCALTEDLFSVHTSYCRTQGESPSQNPRHEQGTTRKAGMCRGAGGGGCTGGGGGSPPPPASPPSAPAGRGARGAGALRPGRWRGRPPSVWLPAPPPHPPTPPPPPPRPQAQTPPSRLRSAATYRRSRPHCPLQQQIRHCCPPPAAPARAWGCCGRGEPCAARPFQAGRAS